MNAPGRSQERKGGPALSDTIGVAMLSMAHVHAEGYANQVQQSAEARLVAIWDEDAERGRQVRPIGELLERHAVVAAERALRVVRQQSEKPRQTRTTEEVACSRSEI